MREIKKERERERECVREREGTRERERERAMAVGSFKIKTTVCYGTNLNQLLSQAWGLANLKNSQGGRSGSLRQSQAARESPLEAFRPRPIDLDGNTRKGAPTSERGEREKSLANL